MQSSTCSQHAKYLHGKVNLATTGISAAGWYRHNLPLWCLETCLLQAAIHRAATQWPVHSMSPSLAADTVATALQQLQRDSQQNQIIIKHVKIIEAKLNALEGSVVTAGTLAFKLSLVSSTKSALSSNALGNVLDISLIMTSFVPALQASHCLVSSCLL